MGLLTVIKKAKLKEKELRLLLVGLDNAGKTTIVRRLNGEDITTVTPTLGFTISSFMHQGYKLNIWDVGGQKSLRPYWRNYFEKTDGLVWVIDSADTVRLKDCAAELGELLKEERLMGSPLLILANKQDIPGALTVEQLGEALHLGDITKRHCKVLACSAVTGEGVLEGFEWMVQHAAAASFSAAW